MNRIMVVFTGICLGWSSLATAQLQGTLFSNEEERAYLDVLRRNFLAERLARGFDIEETDIVIPDIESGNEAAPAGPVYYTLGGIMSRRDGTRRIWLNNQPLEENRLPANASVISDNGILVLQFPTPNGVRILRPGQTLELNGGDVVPNYRRTPSLVPGLAESSAPEEQQAPDNDTPVEESTSEPANSTASRTSQRAAPSGDDDEDEALNAAVGNLPEDLMNNPAAIEDIINILSSRADRLEDERELEEAGDEAPQ
jgi:hypothetical protein